MPAEWFRRPDGSVSSEKPDSLKDIEFKPEVLKADIETSLTSKLTEFSTEQEKKFKPLFDMAAAIEADRAAKSAKEQTERNKKQREENEVTDEDFMLDPTGAVDRKMHGTNTAVKMLAARMAKQDTLGDKEYYHGEIKSKVDAMLAAQSVDSQCRADVIENCYKVVCFDAQKDIAEGKIKAKTSSATFEGGSTGAHSGKDTIEKSDDLTAEEKFVAQKMGISEKDWASSKRELTYV